MIALSQVLWLVRELFALQIDRESGQRRRAEKTQHGRR
jgi:hypothetical protein